MAASALLRFALVLAPLLLLLTPDRAEAYTWMIKHGYASCTVCHADPSGGELLTAYGRVQSKEFLSMWGRDPSQSAWLEPARSRGKAAGPEADAAAAEDPASAGTDASDADTDSGSDAADSGSDADSATDGAAEAPAEEAAPASAPSASAAEESHFHEFLFGAVTLPDWLLLGASYRHLAVIKPKADADRFSTFPMMLDAYGQAQFGMFKLGGSIGGARVDAGSPYARSAQITTNQGKQWNLISRTHYVGVDIDALTIRAGRLNLPFGIRIPEHTMWVRQKTRTDRESGQQHGLAAAYNGDTFRGELMLIAGNYQINPDEFRERGYSGFFEYFLNPTTALGVSSLVTVAKNDRLLVNDTKTTRQVHGASLRATLAENTVLLAEGDGILQTGFETGYVGFLQLDHELVPGLHVMGTGEAVDTGHAKAKDAPARAEGAGKPQLGAWLSADWFFLPHFEFRADFIARQNDEISILGQLHFYL